MKIMFMGFMFWANSQWSEFAILKPYRSWWVEYSYGQQMNHKGELKNLWHWPSLGHTDIRRLEILSKGNNH